MKPSESEFLSPNSLLYWWPKIKDLGIPVPKTIIVELDELTMAEALFESCGTHGIKCKQDKEDCKILLSKYTKDIVMAAKEIGLPFFVRTDHMSGKHDWIETCYVDRPGKLFKQIINILNTQAIAYFPEILVEGPKCFVGALVFREFLKLDTKFKAFKGMPIAPERRYFIKDGKVICHHPYWQDEWNIEDGIKIANRKGITVPNDWRKLLKKANKEESGEISLLSVAAKKVASVMDGWWSVDFAKTFNGQWFLIDMAVAQKSWHPECPLAPEKEDTSILEQQVSKAAKKVYKMKDTK